MTVAADSRPDPFAGVVGARRGVAAFHPQALASLLLSGDPHDRAGIEQLLAQLANPRPLSEPLRELLTELATRKPGLLMSELDTPATEEPSPAARLLQAQAFRVSAAAEQRWAAEPGPLLALCAYASGPSRSGRLPLAGEDQFPLSQAAAARWLDVVFDKAVLNPLSGAGAGRKWRKTPERRGYLAVLLHPNEHDDTWPARSVNAGPIADRAVMHAVASVAARAARRDAEDTFVRLCQTNPPSDVGFLSEKQWQSAFRLALDNAYERGVLRPGKTVTDLGDWKAIAARRLRGTLEEMRGSR